MNKQLIAERKGINPDSEEFLKIPQSYFQAEFLSREEEDELVWFLRNYPTIEIPQHIPSHRVRCIVMREKEDYTPETITDFLRFGIYMIGGNQDLPHIKKERQVEDRGGKKKKEPNPEYRNFKNIPRPERRKILLRLENFLSLPTSAFPLPLSEVKGYLPQWKVFMDRYHPKDFKGICPRVFTLSTIITDKDVLKPIRTWNSILQEKYNSGEKISSIAEYTSSRPKEFLGMLASFLSRSKDSVLETDDIIDCIWNLPDVRNRDLINALEIFDGLAGGPSINISGAELRLRTRAGLDLGVTNVIRENLRYRLAKNIKDQSGLKDLSGGSVFIPEYLKNVPVGKSHTVVPGEEFQIPLDEGQLTLCFSGIQCGIMYLISRDFTCVGKSSNNVFSGREVFQRFFKKDYFKNGNYAMSILMPQSKTKGMELGYMSGEGTTKRTRLFPLSTMIGRERLKNIRNFAPREYPLGIIVDPQTGKGRSFEVSTDGKAFPHGRTMYSYDFLKLYIQEHGGTIVDKRRDADLVMDSRDIDRILGK